MIEKKYWIGLLFFLFTNILSSFALTFYANSPVSSNKTWDDPTAWYTNGCPGSGGTTNTSTYPNDPSSGRSNDDVVFCSGMGVYVDVSGLSCRNITFQGGTLDFSAKQTLTVNGTLSATSGTSYILGTKTGTINVAGAFSVSSGATMNLERSAISFGSTTTVNGDLIFDGSNTGTKTFSGTVTLSSTGTWDNTNGETLTINANIVCNGSWLGCGGGDCKDNVNDGGSYTISGSTGVSMSQIHITGSSTLTNNGTLTLTYATAEEIIGGSASCTFTNGNGATLHFSGAGNSGAEVSKATFNTSSASGGANAVIYDYNGAQSIATPSDAGYYNLQTGTGGTKTLLANGVVSNTLTVNTGTTLANGGFTISTGTITLANTGGSGGGTISGSALLTLGGDVTVSYSGSGSSTGSVISCPVALTNATIRTFTVSDDGSVDDDLTISGIISTTGGLTLGAGGGGTLLLSGVNTYTGATTINSGTLQAGVATNSFGSGSNITLANTAGATLNITGFNTTIGSLAGGGTTGGNIVLGGATLTFGNATTSTYSGVISGTGSIVYNGSVTQTMSGSNTYTGTTTVNSGTMAAGIITQAFGVGSDVTVASGATLTISGFNSTIGSIAGAGNVTLGASTLTFGDAGSQSYSGVMSGGGSIIKNGTGTETFSGSSVFSGGVTINAGTLSASTMANSGITHPSALGNGSLIATISIGGSGTLQYTGLATSSNRPISLITSNGGTIDASGTGLLTLTGGISGGGGNPYNLILTGTGSGSVATTAIAATIGSVTKNGTGTWSLNVANAFAGGVTLNTGTIDINNATSLGTSAGTFTINGGTIDNTNGSSVTIVNSPIAINASFTFTGSNPLVLGSGTVTLSASPTITISANILTVAGTINNSAQSLTLSGSGTLAFVSQSVTLNALTINSGPILTSTSGTLSLAGNFSISGTYTANGGNVTFNGSSAQTITAASAGGVTFYDLTLAGGNTVSLLNGSSNANNITVNDKLAFTVTKSYLALNSNTLTMANTTSLSSGSITTVNSDFTNTFIIFANGSSTFTFNNIGAGSSCKFPMCLGNSTNTNFCEVDIANSDASHTTFTITNICNYVNQSGGCSGGTIINTHNVNFTYTITSASTNATVTLYWDRSQEMTNFLESSCQLNHYGTHWTLIGSAGAATNVSGTIYSKSAPTTSFSPFGVGFGGSPLPIELLSFTAELVNRKVDLKWTTATETNNNFFTIERSSDARIFDTVCLMKGAGNSSAVLSYSAVDPTPVQGTSYYRLKQTDFDGKCTYSQLVPVSVNNADRVEYLLFPNPAFVGQNSQLKINSQEDRSVLLVVRDISGREMYANVVIVQKNMNSIVAVDPEQKLSPGLYMVVATSDNSVFNQKLIVR